MNEARLGGRVRMNERSRRKAASESTRRSFDAACRDAEVSDADREPMWRLFLQWSWPGGEASPLEVLLSEHRHLQLYRASRNGDAEAARRFEQHWRRYATSALKWRLPKSDIEELIAAFFERVYRLVGSTYSWNSPFTVYLRTTLVNLARTEGRRLGQRAARESSIEDVETTLATRTSKEPDPESTLLSEERRQKIENGLRTLTPIDRIILVRSLAEDSSGEELARELGMSRDAVYKRLQRAKKKLRATYERDGLLSDP